MADNPVIPAAQPSEPVDTLDRVITELNKPEEPPAAAPAAPPEGDKPAGGADAQPKPDAKPGDAPAAAEPKPAEAAGPVEPFKVGEEAKFKISDTAVKTREEIEKLPYANDASFKAIMGEFEGLAQFKSGMAQALNEVESAGKYVIPDADTMKAVVADAYNLYDVINLHRSPIELLELAAKNYGDENIKQVIAQILLYAEEKGITKENYSDLSKPENKKIFELAKESRERKAKEATETTTKQQAAEAERRESDFKGLETRVNTWAKENKVDESDVLDYLTFVVAQIGGDQKQLEAIRAGKFGEVDKILTDYNNRMVERQSRWEKALTDRKAAREKQLGGAPPAGGGTPPAEPPKKKVNVLDDDERMAAVRAGLRE